MSPAPPVIAIMDTTLRDGEQTPDVAYTPEEKLQLARLLLEEVKVDRIEIASGLAEDDTVVAKAGTFLRDGDAVRPVLSNSTTRLSEVN